MSDSNYLNKHWITINSNPWRIDNQLLMASEVSKLNDAIVIFKSYIWDILICPDSHIDTLIGQFDSLIEKEEISRNKVGGDINSKKNEKIDITPFFDHINSINNTDFGNIIILLEWFEKYFELQWLTRNINKDTVVEKIIETIEKVWYKFNYNPTKEVENLTWNDPEVIKFTIWHLLVSLKEERGVIRSPLLDMLSNIKKILKKS